MLDARSLSIPLSFRRLPSAPWRREPVRMTAVSSPAPLGFPYEEPDKRLAAATEAFLAGDLTRCIHACRTAARSSDAWLRFDAAVLSARALIRLGKNWEARSTLERLDAADDPRAAVVTMLHGAALMRLGERAKGAAELERVTARGLDDPVAVEATLEISRMDLQFNDFAAATRRLSLVPARNDMMGARVLEHRAFAAFARSQYDDALEGWQASLDLFAACGATDQLIVANITFGMSIVALERIDPDVWDRAARLADGCSYLRRGPSVTAHQLHYVASLWHDLFGRPLEALQSIRFSEEFAPTDLARLAARGGRAAVFHHYGERLACAEECSTMRRDFGALDSSSVARVEDENSVSEIAQTLAEIGDSDGAIAALSRHDLATDRHDAPLHSSTRAATFHVDSLIADAAGETFKARHLLDQAFQAWQRLGNRRRALFAAIHLLEIGPHREALAYADAVTRSLPPESWVRAAYVRLSQRLPASESRSLNRAQRDVLEMLVRGLSTAEIAQRRGRSEGTTRNTISSLLRTFGVSTRQALLAEYLKGAKDAEIADERSSDRDARHGGHQRGRTRPH